MLAALGVEDAVERVQRAGGLDIARDWGDLLSLAEQRLVDIARVVLAKPDFAVFGDMEDGLGSEHAGRVRAMLASRGIGLLELRERRQDEPCLEPFAVEISDDGSWKQNVP